MRLQILQSSPSWPNSPTPTHTHIKKRVKEKTCRRISAKIKRYQNPINTIFIIWFLPATEEIPVWKTSQVLILYMAKFLQWFVQVFLNSIHTCINAFHRLLTSCTTKAIKYFNRGKAFLSTSKGYKWFCCPNNIHYFGGKAHSMVS